MNKSQLAKILNVSEDDISQALHALNIERKQRVDLSSGVAIQVEELIQRATEKNVSYKVAVQEIQAEQSAIPSDVSEMLGDISDEVSQELERLLVKAVPDIKGNMQETIRRRQAVLRKLIAQLVDRNIIKQLKTIDPIKMKAELSEPLTIEVLEGKPVTSLPSTEAG